MSEMIITKEQQKKLQDVLNEPAKADHYASITGEHMLKCFENYYTSRGKDVHITRPTEDTNQGGIVFPTRSKISPEEFIKRYDDISKGYEQKRQQLIKKYRRLRLVSLIVAFVIIAIVIYLHYIGKVDMFWQWKFFIKH